MRPVEVGYTFDWRPPAKPIRGYAPRGVLLETHRELRTAAKVTAFLVEAIRSGDAPGGEERAGLYDSLAFQLGAMASVHSLDSADLNQDALLHEPIELGDGPTASGGEDASTRMLLVVLEDAQNRHPDPDVREDTTAMLTCYQNATMEMMLDRPQSE